MFKWVQSGLSAVAGLAEPEYGADAIRPVTDIPEGEPVYRETDAKDFLWQGLNYTNVETQTFYFTCLKTGFTGFAQIIHSNVMGVHTTAQFTFRLCNFKDGKNINLWTSTKLEDFEIKGNNFYAKNLSFELVGENKYILKSSVTEESIVEFEVEKLVPGVIFGKNGETLYGEDLENPWGSMRHVFWPRCSVKGTIKTKEGDYEIDGLTMFVMALQGMKPHHAAKSWNFLNFQSENYSAVQMEFTTPKSYANTKVNIGIVCSKDKILCASINNNVVHKDSVVDEVGWPVPKAISFHHDDDKFHGEVSGNLDRLVERVDVMAEIPQFVKNIVSGVAGAKPYIYQYLEDFEIKFDDVSEKGVAYTEVTFITEFD
ncbi:survival factor 1 [[Candida] jaroonii]|uniref:Survival factor 1 n=1 Tax=[Candida] jaroonii TaxID=467808 RepID=A0ACA9Y461_9ASCO|nr:survival factor 1 [[Candida] jaroonii]